MTDSRVIVALDCADARSALELVQRLTPGSCRVKVGKELFTAAGPGLVETLQHRGFDVFLDLKFHDIPSTVAQACKAGAALGVWMLNVHALGGSAMMRAAREALGMGDRPRLIGVTVLTSMGIDDLREVGVDETPVHATGRLALLARASGLDGVVCSAQEAAELRRLCGESFLLVTPGIRPEGSSADDQKRIMSPRAAVRAGAHYLVVGRPITRANDPALALEAINREVRESLEHGLAS